MHKMNKYIFTIMLIIISPVTFACENENNKWSRDRFGDMHVVEGPFSTERIIKENTYIPAGQTEPTVHNKFSHFSKLFAVGDKIYTVKLEYGYSSTKTYVLVRNNCIISRHSKSHTLHNKAVKRDNQKAGCPLTRRYA